MLNSDNGEQITLDLIHFQDMPLRRPDSDEDQVNVFRADDRSDEKKDMVRKHKQWLDTVQREYPKPETPYRIGVYIRYFNQTRYKDYLEFHKKEFQDTIGLCPQWKLVDFYVDHGMSAPNMENAPEWCRLVSDCFNGKVNLIVTQKVSNVARKPDNIAFLARIFAAQEPPVGIYFISEDIFTLASYYQHDLHDDEFLPEGMNIIKDNEPDRLISGGTDDESYNE